MFNTQWIIFDLSPLDSYQANKQPQFKLRFLNTLNQLLITAKLIILFLKIQVIFCQGGKDVFSFLPLPRLRRKK